jgi:acetylornithine deacetylase/succinyl-diaminopimelate desuccinylase-like protein
MDTVPCREADGWTHSPYSATVADGCLYGLGAADCKGGLAAQIYAGALLKRSLLPLRGKLVVAATVAEENGCSVGMRALIERTLPELNLVPSFAVLGEPTGMRLYYGHDGWVEMDIQIEGSNPFHVDDAARAVFKDCSSRLSGEPGLFNLHRPQFQNSGAVRRAVVQVDHRLRASDTVGSVIARTQHEAMTAAQTTGNVAVAVTVRQEQQKLYTGQTTMVRRVVQAWSIDPFHPLMERSRQVLAAAGLDGKPGKWELGKMGMGTAGGVLTHEFQIPTIGYGPGSENMAHAANESVSIANLSQSVYGTAAIVHSLVGIPVFGWSSDDI